MARSCTALLLLSVALEYKFDLRGKLPHVHASFTRIAVRVIVAGDRQHVALENARLSARGAIRKAHDVITWLGKLWILRCDGLDPGAVLKEWNSMATKESQVTGNKRAACLQLLEAPEPAVKILLEHVSEYGSESAFQEDAFSNKKVMPSFVPRANNNKVWMRRLTVTNEGFLLMVRFLDAEWSRKPHAVRRKYDKTQMEEASLVANLLEALICEVQAAHPIKDDIIDNSVRQRLVDSDMTLELELSMAAKEMKVDFTYSCISLINELIRCHVSSAAEHSAASLPGAAPSVLASNLERQEFDLVLKSIEHDLDAYRLWSARARDREAAVYHQRMNHARDRVRKARAAVDTIFDRSSSQFRMALFGLEKLETVINEINHLKLVISRLNQLDDSDVVPHGQKNLNLKRALNVICKHVLKPCP